MRQLCVAPVRGLASALHLLLFACLRMTNIMRKKSTLVAAATSEQLAKQTINLFAERAQLSLCWRDPTRVSLRLILISLHPQTKETNETLPTAFAAVVITVLPLFRTDRSTVLSWSNSRIRWASTCRRTHRTSSTPSTTSSKTSGRNRCVGVTSLARRECDV